MAGVRAFLGAFDLVPGWVYAAALAACLVMLASTTGRAMRLDAELARAETSAAKLEAARQVELRRHAEEKLALREQHEIAMYAAETDYAQKLTAASVRARADAATVGRLRDQINAYANRGGTCSPAAAESDGGKSSAQVLGGLLAESVELLAEGRALHELRDAEMSLLFDQIDADRAACSGTIRARSPAALGG